MGCVLQGLGIYYTACDIATLGLPAWAWYLVGTIMLSASFISIIINLRKENKRLQGMITADNDLRIMEWRQDYRKPQKSQVTNIPQTLSQIWKTVEGVMAQKKSRRVPRQKLLNMIVSLLAVPKDDPILSADSYSTEDKIRKITKRFESKLGLRKSNLKLEAEWRSRIAKEMDICKIGLQLDESKEYTDLVKQLNDDRTHITRSKIDHAIDGFLDNLHALYSVQLLFSYANPKRKLSIFPSRIRGVLSRIEESSDRAMRGFLRRVNENLEDYAMGKDLNEQ